MEITSVADAIQIVDENSRYLSDIYDPDEEGTLDPYYPFPIGVWFRGHSRASYKIVPSVFRTPAEGKWYDEGMMIQHAKLRNPSEQRPISTFDLLCLLQHYNLPTRLIDWTESVLIALYFAVDKEEDDEEDGKLFALNARRLNSVTRLHDPETRYICAATSIDVIIRTEMASARRKKDIRYSFAKNGALEVFERVSTGNHSAWVVSGIYFFKQWLEGGGLDNEHKNRLLKLLRAPVAVFPNRMNPRMTSQLAMVLVCGGKVAARCNGNLITNDADILPSFTNEDDLEQLNITEPKKFLQSFIIPKQYKEKIRRQLTRIGIHEATLFPEIDHVGNFVRKQWILPSVRVI